MKKKYLVIALLIFTMGITLSSCYCGYYGYHRHHEHYYYR